MRHPNIRDTDLAKVMGELLLIFNNMSKATLESKIHSKVGQTSWNLKEHISYLQSNNCDRTKVLTQRATASGPSSKISDNKTLLDSSDSKRSS